MKSILISIKPEWVRKILRGEKAVEIRKTEPKCELPVTVYIYCTKGKPNLWLPYEHDCFELDEASQPYLSDKPIFDIDTKMNGKVVARFTLRKVERFIQGLNEDEYERLPNFALQDYDYHGLDCLMEKACLNDDEINEYAPDLSFYAWHISDLEIFDEPKELSDFKSYKKNVVNTKINGMVFETELDNSLTKAPQAWCYVEER